MSFFSGGFFSKEKLKNSLNSITQPIKNLADKGKQLIAEKIEKAGPKIEFNLIYNRIFWMAYPTKEKSKSLSNIINTQFKKNNYFIWNVSEHKYEATLFENQVAEYCFVGYPCPPLQYIFLIVKSIIEWLNADAENVAIIHCQASKGRSALVISCLLSVLKITNHPMEALGYFCTKLRLEQDTLLFPPQMVALRNFANIMDNIKVQRNIFNNDQLNNKICILKRVTLSEVPQVTQNKSEKDKEPAELKPYIQIFKGSQAIYNYLTKQSNFIHFKNSREEPKSYNPNECPITFQLDIELTEEILVRCRHFVTPEDRVSVCRLLFHPMMAFSEVFKFPKKDIEISPDITVSEEFYIEMEVKFTDRNQYRCCDILGENHELISINKLKEDCQKEAEIYNSKKDKFLLPKTISVKKPEKKVEEDINPLKEVYEKAVVETDGNASSGGEAKPAMSNETVNKILDSIEKDHDEKGEIDDEDMEEYLKKLENQ